MTNPEPRTGVGSPEAFDLVLRGGRVCDPGAGIDGTFDVGFLNGKVAALRPRIRQADATVVLDVQGRLVVPGLVDLHTHIYWGGTSIGVDASQICARSGTTTFVDAGSAGAGNFKGFRRFIVEASDLNILAFINVSYAGIFGFMADVVVGESGDLRLLDEGECIKAAMENRDIVVGVKVRVGAEASGVNGTRPLEVARSVADKLGVPVMVHVDTPPPDLGSVMRLLRKGDIWTHCFRPEPNSIVSAPGKVEAEIMAARERGVIFDVGHGYGSFSFEVATEMLEQGLYPDCISSDVHSFSIDQRARDLLHTASKFIAIGMSVEEVVRRVTANPAAALGRQDLGSLAPGSRGDAVVLEHVEEEVALLDGLGKVLVGKSVLRPVAVVCNGAVRHSFTKP